MQDLDGQIHPALAENLLLLLAQHLARTVMRIDHAVADLKLHVWKRLVCKLVLK